VGLIPTISPYLLPKIAPALRRKFPKLTFAWVEDRTDALIQKLTAGALEAAILALEAEVGDVEHEVIATDPFVFVAPKGHRLAEGAAISSSALRGEEVLLLDEGHCFRNQALEVCGTARESEFRATSLSTLVQMVAAGAGVTLLPELALPMEASRATLRARPLSSSAAHRTIALVWRRRSPLEGTLRAVAAVLRDAYPAAKAPRGIK
jgi:LysR family hydrogen peroxide-inducible transcriptional activator